MIGRTTPAIARLEPHVVNQIAAGEVIERPASVVKELVENSIDSGAVTIDVELEEGGKRLIRVTDDGLGIAEEDLLLALESHATSKLRTSGDLAEILTLGFRGEALASIASVAEVDLVSRPPGADVGARVVSDGRNVERGRPEMIPHGTRITVKNLFHQVPARQRFLKGDRAELTRIRSSLESIALALPSLGFSLRHNGRVVFRYPSGQEELERVQEILGEEWGRQLIRVDSGDGRLHGWAGRPDLSRRTSQSIYTMLNGRPLRDSVVLHAVRHAYQGFQIPGRYPVAVLYLTLEPSDVDVNVHPAKLEVRFRDRGAVHSLVHRSVRRGLEAAGSVPALEPRERSAPPSAGTPPSSARPTSSSAGASTASGSSSRDDTNLRPGGWRDLVASEPRSASLPAMESHSEASGVAEGSPLHESPLHELPSRDSEASATEASVADVSPAEVRAVDTTPTLVDGRETRVFQVHNAFLIVEEEDGLSVIDQHALHEKIIYEELSEAESEGTLRQPLLIPETLRLPAPLRDELAACLPALTELGFEVEEFGDAEVIVRAVPVGFERGGAAKLLEDVLERLAELRRHGSEDNVELRHHLRATVACKRAVKAGQPLPREMQLDLVRGRARAFQPQNCPHGRPSELFLSWEELSRRFDRK